MEVSCEWEEHLRQLPLKIMKEMKVIACTEQNAVYNICSTMFTYQNWDLPSPSIYTDIESKVCKNSCDADSDLRTDRLWVQINPDWRKVNITKTDRNGYSSTGPVLMQTCTQCYTCNPPQVFSHHLKLEPKWIKPYHHANFSIIFAAPPSPPQKASLKILQRLCLRQFFVPL